MSIINSETKYRNYFIASLLLIMLVFTGRYLQGGCRFSHFIVLGDLFIDASEHPYDVKINENSWGYDGQQFYLYSLKPNLKENKYVGIPTHLHYRKQRILYPLVVWLLSFGSPTAVPVVMVLVNLICLVILTFVSYKIIKSANAPPIYILLVGALVGNHIALTRDLAEAMEAMFLTLIFLAFYRRNIWGFVMAASAALLTRETSVLIIAPAVLVWLYQLNKQKELFQFKALVLLFPLGVLFLWKVYLYFTFGGYAGAEVQWIPFKGILDGLSKTFQNELLVQQYGKQMLILYDVYNIVLIGWVWFTLILGLRKIDYKASIENKWGKLSLYIWIAFGMLLSYKIYESDLSFMRVFNGILLVSFLTMAISKIKLPWYYLLATFGVYLSGLVRIVIST